VESIRVIVLNRFEVNVSPAAWAKLRPSPSPDAVPRISCNSISKLVQVIPLLFKTVLVIQEPLLNAPIVVANGVPSVSVRAKVPVDIIVSFTVQAVPAVVPAVPVFCDVILMPPLATEKIGAPNKFELPTVEAATKAANVMPFNFMSS